MPGQIAGTRDGQAFREAKVPLRGHGCRGKVIHAGITRIPTIPSRRNGSESHRCRPQTKPSEQIMKSEANLQSTGLSNVLVAASLRAEQWRQLNALARSWNASGDSPRATGLRAQCKELAGTISRIEHCWAFPGQRLLGVLRKALDDGDASAFAPLANRISAAPPPR